MRPRALRDRCGSASCEVEQQDLGGPGRLNQERWFVGESSPIAGDEGSAAQVDLATQYLQPGAATGRKRVLDRLRAFQAS
jgi:hypothetical protein